MADQHIQVRMPVELAAGAFADFIRAWHTDEAFVLDFAAFSEPPRMEDDKVIRDATVVSRVRIPPSQVFELMKALEQQLSAWEKEHPNRKA
ncbi:MAG: DUF3467 domain-containing protein [Propionibacteriaceae bacterium]|nr:DUF3467 domain-containing protein [Propionibacteriaceae bacterium]